MSTLWTILKVMFRKRRMMRTLQTIFEWFCELEGLKRERGRWQQPLNCLDWVLGGGKCIGGRCCVGWSLSWLVVVCVVVAGVVVGMGLVCSGHGISFEIWINVSINFVILIQYVCFAIVSIYLFSITLQSLRKSTNGCVPQMTSRT